ncbi:MAG: hypothetical protein CMM55_17435 [Rhodospirillaceae bacterium]|nr:hypothetical protein [Rhodospirillaceae bacterium]
MFNVVDACRVCGSGGLQDVLDLGAQPPANHLRRPDEVPPDAVPLDLQICGNCETAQITATIDPEVLFGTYLWVTGTSAGANAYSSVFVNRVESIPGLRDPSGGGDPRSVIEIASNDGTFLRRFSERGWTVLGVDPAVNIADRAHADGIPTRCDFFGVDVATEIVADQGHADVVVARNVVPHVADIHSVVEGLAVAAGDDGVVVIEAHDAQVILDELHYDSIYHEHLFYFSLSTLCSLCRRHGLEAFDVHSSPISGGSQVVFLSRRIREPSERLSRAADQACSEDQLQAWSTFAADSRSHAEALREVVIDAGEKGKVIGYGASARSSTMLNFAGLGNVEISAIIDQNPLKHDRLTAGTDIPIVSLEAGLELLNPPDTVLLLAWNFRDEIRRNLVSNGFEGQVIVPLPGEVRVI